VLRCHSYAHKALWLAILLKNGDKLSHLDVIKYFASIDSPSILFFIRAPPHDSPSVLLFIRAPRSFLSRDLILLATHLRILVPYY
jgi:hypothetical protein